MISTPSTHWPTWLERYGAWLHVDGAFGLFARATPRGDGPGTAGSSGPTRIAADGHKWLNVPYESGFALDP